jgi:hypothetical protein
MPLPRIPGAEEIIVPAVAEKTYPDAYMVSLQVIGRPGQTQRAVITYCPYNYDTGESLTGKDKTIVLKDLMATATERAMANKPALAQAMGAVLLAVAEIIAEQ